MEYVLSFLEGVITFISPCLLPMFPIYLSYFAGGDVEAAKSRTLLRAFGFTAGFTLVFVVMGAFAGTVGGLLKEYQTIVNIITGAIVIFFGLHFTGILKIPLLNRNYQMSFGTKNLGFFSSVLFGIVFSIGWTPCVGAFLGSALMMAASGGGSVKGIVLLLFYSIGLALPFIASAILIDRLKSTFVFIKKHYKIINRVSGIFLIIVGIFMMVGFMGYFMAFFSF